MDCSNEGHDDDNDIPLDEDDARLKSVAQRSTDDTEEFTGVIDRITAYDPDKNLFHVLWEGYTPEDATWEPPVHLPYNAMMRYSKSKKHRVPRAILPFRKKR